VWIVEVTNPVAGNWQEREKLLTQRAGRQWGDWISVDGVRVLKWFCNTLDEARGLTDALRKVGGVMALFRDPINGR
jgi:hypothetical protein